MLHSKVALVLLWYETTPTKRRQLLVFVDDSYSTVIISGHKLFSCECDISGCGYLPADDC